MRQDKTDNGEYADDCKEYSAARRDFRVWPLRFFNSPPVAREPPRLVEGQDGDDEQHQQAETGITRELHARTPSAGIVPAVTAETSFAARVTAVYWWSSSRKVAARASRNFISNQ